MKFFLTSCALLLSFFVNVRTVLAADSTNLSSHLIVSYNSDGRTLLGYLYRPEGAGPFPAVLFHHGDKNSLMSSEVAQWKAMAKFFTSRGYLLFLPDRHPEAIARSEYSAALQAQLQSKNTN